MYTVVHVYLLNSRLVTGRGKSLRAEGWGEMILALRMGRIAKGKEKQVVSIPCCRRALIKRRVTKCK